MSSRNGQDVRRWRKCVQGHHMVRVFTRPSSVGFAHTLKEGVRFQLDAIEGLRNERSAGTGRNYGQV